MFSRLWCWIAVLEILLLFPLAAFSNDVSGCGGFVRFRGYPNRSDLKIKLLSNKGIVKYTSDVAPNNGYYFVPLYDHGEYILRVDSPKGFDFEPKEVKINFDGVNDVCSKQQDINFFFQGFLIIGRITSPSSEIGPRGVILQLFSGDSMIQQQFSRENGDYEFTTVMPGEYRIEATHLYLKFKQNSATVVVKDSHIQLGNTIQIYGYPLYGYVDNQGQGISGVSFAIFSKSVSSVLCNQKIVPAFVTKLNADPALEFLCIAISDSKGEFEFPALPNGDYVVMPFYETAGTRFEVLPKMFEVYIKDHKYYIEKTFTIGGFTVTGKFENPLKPSDIVVPQNMELFSQADDEILYAKIGNDGTFTIENIKSGKYLVRIGSQRYYFEDEIIEVSPKNLSLPVFKPSKYQICGKVMLTTDDFDETDPEMKLGVLEFYDSRTSLDYYPFRVPEFCIFMNPGKFSFFIESPIQGPKFLPKSVDLDIVEPVTNLLFHKFTAKITGKVVFKDSSKLDTVEVILTQGTHVVARQLFPKSSKNSFDFIFQDTTSGEYSLTLGDNLLEKFCWKKSIQSFTVSDSHIENVLFEQTGYLCKLSLSHASDISITSPSGKTIDIPQDPFGNEQFEEQCFEEFGIYDIKFKSCHIFTEQPNNHFRFDTSHVEQLGQVLRFDAKMHMVSGLIQASSNLTDLGLKITIDGGAVRKLKIDDFRVNQINNQVVYSFSFHEKPNRKLKIEPTSGEVLFKPPFQEILIDNDCKSLPNNFLGKRGIKIEGSVDKQIADVDITVFDRATHDVLCITKTNALGKYICGPFDDDIRLRIEASKDGYHFKLLPGKYSDFETFKLSSVSGQLLAENGQAMNDVLVSISGGENNYRKNAVFNGQFRFENLQPGQYFIRFMKKEYEFTPQSEMIDIKGGEDVLRTVRGVKVAFSCIGKIAALNGEPEAGAIVEASGLKNIGAKKSPNSVIDCAQIMEEAVSDHAGVYKVLGLTPQCLYEVRLKNDSKQHVRDAIPSRREVQVFNQDIENVNFIALYRPTSGDVSVYVNAKPEILKSLTAKLFLGSAMDKALSEQKFGSNPFVFFPPQSIDHSNYIIKLESDLPSRMFAVDRQPETIVHSFELNESFMHFRFDYDAQLRPEFVGNTISDKIGPDSGDSIDTRSRLINSFAFILLLALGLVYIYYKQIFEFVAGLSQSSAKKGVDGDSDAKKNKNKPKKQ